MIKRLTAQVNAFKKKGPQETNKKPQHSPHKHRPIDYGATQKLVQPTDDSPPLNDIGIKKSPRNCGSINLYRKRVNNKLLVALSAIGPQQAAATEETKDAIEQLLDYVAT